MELQLALDRIEKKRAIDIVESLKDLIDIVEIGTPFSIMQPIEIINDFKKISPCLPECLQTIKLWMGAMLLQKSHIKLEQTL